MNSKDRSNWSAGRTSGLGWRTQACTLTMASTAPFLNTAIGQSLNEVRDAGAALKALLSGLKTSFLAPWEALEVLVAALLPGMIPFDNHSSEYSAFHDPNSVPARKVLVNEVGRGVGC